MFDTIGAVPSPSLASAAASIRPIAPIGSLLLEIEGPLAPLFPEGGVRRGSTLALGPLAGGCTLAISLLAEVTGRGGWAAVVGIPSLNLVAAEEGGADLSRVAVVTAPPERWSSVVAALVDGFELLVCRPVGSVRPVEARRLAARVRERRAVMAVLDAPGWPEPLDLRLTAGAQRWEGLGEGHGHLAARRMEISCGGRRAGGRERRVSLWLPGATAEQAVEGLRVVG